MDLSPIQPKKMRIFLNVTFFVRIYTWIGVSQAKSLLLTLTQKLINSFHDEIRS